MALWTLKDKSILTIDDFPGMRSMLRTMLSSYGAVNIVEAGNGNDAVRLITQQHFDIILCDYNLGDGKDGQQVLEEVKAGDHLPYATIYIMTTAENTSEMVMGAVEYQPDDYLSKPFTKQTLIARLKKLIDKKNGLREISQAILQSDYGLAAELCNAQLEKEPRNRSELTRIKGELALRMQDYDEAETIYRNILDTRELAWARLGLGQVCFYRGQYLDARFIFEEIIDLNPNYVFAHDWLARAHRHLGNLKKSQKVLEDAIKKSPKAVMRQQQLAQTALDNQDYDCAEDAFKRVLRIGKYSCYRGPDDFLGLSRVYIKKGMTIEALKSLGNMRKEFRAAEPGDKMKSLVHETIIYHELERNDDTRKSIHEIINLFTANPVLLLSDDAMILARICYDLKMQEEGDTFLRHVIRNNHDNESVLDTVKSLLLEFGADENSIAMIIQTRNEVIATNNRGVKLATRSELKESIALFEKAAAAMPENNIINLNAAQSLIMLMNKTGADKKRLAEAKCYLSRVHFDGKPSDKYHKISAAYRKLQQSLPDKIYP